MNRLRNNWRSGGILLALAVVLVATAPGPGEAQSGRTTSVFVTNSAADPVPTKVQNALFEPIYTIVNNSPGSPLPTVVNNEVLVNGLVALNPLGNGVKVLNNMTDLAYLRDRDNPAFQPFHRTVQIQLPDGVGQTSDSSIVVPSNKRLVIETVSWQFSVTPGVTARASLNTRADSTFAFHYMQASLTAAGDFVVGTHTVKIYCDPDSAVEFAVVRSSSTGFAAGNFTISGYLVDVP